MRATVAIIGLIEACELHEALLRRMVGECSAVKWRSQDDS
jgi:hypothetical protein